MATQAVLDADPIQPQHVASTSTFHSIIPHTRSETHRLALDKEHLATNQLASYERDAIQDQHILHQDTLARCVPETLVILDLPASRVTPNLTGRAKPQQLHTYEFRDLCTLCNQTHPQYSRGKGCFMRAFIGPCKHIPSHVMTEIPTPTTFWTLAQTRSGEYDIPGHTYGHRSQGIYLSPLSQLLVPGADLWDINFRLMGCDGLREWNLRVLPEEVHSTLVTVLWLCRTSGDK
jgi:hypothetical protein